MVDWKVLGTSAARTCWQHAEWGWLPHTTPYFPTAPRSTLSWDVFLNFVKIAYFTTEVCYVLRMWHFRGTHYCQALPSKVCEVLFQLNVKMTDNWNSTYTKQHFKEKRILVGPELFFQILVFLENTDDWFHSLPIDGSGNLAQLLLLLRTARRPCSVTIILTPNT